MAASDQPTIDTQNPILVPIRSIHIPAGIWANAASTGGQKNGGQKNRISCCFLCPSVPVPVFLSLVFLSTPESLERDDPPPDIGPQDCVKARMFQ